MAMIVVIMMRSLGATMVIKNAQKAKINEELLPTAWHPSRWQDWCMSETEKWWK